MTARCETIPSWCPPSVRDPLPTKLERASVRATHDDLDTSIISACTSISAHLFSSRLHPMWFRSSGPA